MNTKTVTSRSIDCLLLAVFIQQRREELRLTTADAAHLAGLQFSQWCALENGWIPTIEHNTLRAVADTLMASVGQLTDLALLGQFANEK